MTPPLPPDTADRPARERLLEAGLRLFADHGFAKTSTRELAEAAGVNIASISYYFGDKAGLYRAVFTEPMGDAPGPEHITEAGLPLPEALRRFYAGFLEPLRQGDVARLCVKLHFREMVEPTGLWDHHVAGEIQPLHDALTAVLQRHLGLDAPDDDLLRLVVSLTALGVHLHVGRDVTDHLAPGLYDGADAPDRWSRHLVAYGLAMVETERKRRKEAA